MTRTRPFCETGGPSTSVHGDQAGAGFAAPVATRREQRHRERPAPAPRARPRCKSENPRGLRSDWVWPGAGRDLAQLSSEGVHEGVHPRLGRGAASGDALRWPATCSGNTALSPLPRQQRRRPPLRRDPGYRKEAAFCTGIRSPQWLVHPAPPVLGPEREQRGDPAGTGDQGG